MTGAIVADGEVIVAGSDDGVLLNTGLFQEEIGKAMLEITKYA